MLPIGVIIPTKNSAGYLPAHLTALQEWLPLVQEVVVVDSFSTDGTVDIVRQNLAHARLLFLQHPPGLYQSWNYGISHISAKYVYMATVGDLITRAGIEQLYKAAESLAADVVISKPEFRDVDGRLVEIRWPIDDIIETLGIGSPRRLHRLEAIVFACVHANQALTGSCASDLFRTEILQRCPFPTEFGTVGDGAWSVMHAAEATWGILPQKCSSFLKHPCQASKEERVAYGNAPRMDAVLRSAAAAWLGSGTISQKELARIGWEDLLSTLSQLLDATSQCSAHRRGSFPWVFNPAAWRARARRTELSAKLHRLKSSALRQIDAPQHAASLALSS